MLLLLLIQSDIKVYNTAPLNTRRYLCKLRVSGPDVVLIAGRDLVREVQLADEGLASVPWAHHLGRVQNRKKSVAFSTLGLES